jgi:hypothetical protein
LDRENKWLPQRPIGKLPKVERIGDYCWMEIYDDNGQLLIRIGADHELTQDEVKDLIQQLLTSPTLAEEVIGSGGSNFG